MAITNTILLKGLLGAVVCLGSASAAIANRGKIVSYFSKDKDDKKGNGADSKKPKGEGKAQNAESTTHSDKGATENSPSVTPNGTGKDTGKTANEGQGSNAPGGAGTNPGQSGQAQPVPSNPDSGADTTTGQATSTGGKGEKGSGDAAGQPGASGPSQSTQTNTDNNEINKKITDTLKLPEDCKFDSSVKDNTKECDLTEEQLKKVNFVNKNGTTDLTIDGASGGLKLEIRKFNKPKEDEKKRYGNSIGDNDLWFTFKNLTTEVKIKGKSDQDITLKKGTSPEFSIYSEKLTKAWYPSSLGFKVGLSCDDNGKCCTPKGEDKTINLFYATTSSIKKIKVKSDDKSEKITVTKDQEGYNQGYKFNVPKNGISASEGTDKLDEGDYEIKYISDKKEWALSKVTTASQAK